MENTVIEVTQEEFIIEINGQLQSENSRRQNFLITPEKKKRLEPTIQWQKHYLVSDQL